MLFMIMVGAYSLNYFLFISGIQSSLRTIVLSWHVSPFLMVMGMMFIMMLLGMVLETSAMYMLTVPFFVPIITVLGIDPILFGIIMIMAGEMAQITPPVGVNLFVLNAVTGVPVVRIAWGTLPYVGMLWLMIITLYFIPQIALWLPDKMWM
jgi:C4-dicarboxylate transporter DctM subunit